MGSNHMHEAFKNSKRINKIKNEEAFPKMGEVKSHKVEKKKTNIRTKEIPLIDPQTGELNPLYEELMGQPHPYSKKSKSFKQEGIGKFNMPPFIEPKLKSRFIVKFPESFGIPEWGVSSVTRPTYFVEGKKWEDIAIILTDSITPSTSQALSKLIETEKIGDEFTFEICILGPDGDIIDKWEITGKFKSIDFGELDYHKSGITEILGLVTPTKCKLLF